jgi:hypothetical protein
MSYGREMEDDNQISSRDEWHYRRQHAGLAQMHLNLAEEAASPSMQAEHKYAAKYHQLVAENPLGFTTEGLQRVAGSMC